ncbi:MAG: DinB family protein [Fimbriimonadaceae bacterium]
MNQAALIRAQLASVRGELMEAVDRLDDSMLAWAPGPGMRTIHGQLVEILMTEVSLQERISGRERRAVKEIEAPFRAAESVSGLKVLLDEVRQETLRLLELREASGMDDVIEVSAGFASWLGLETVIASELFRHIARHEAYHAGQLVSYLWARGDDPYEWPET